MVGIRVKNGHSGITHSRLFHSLFVIYWDNPFCINHPCVSHLSQGGKKMQAKPVVLLAMLLVFAVVFAVSPSAEAAQEGEWDNTSCWAGELWTITHSKQHLAGTYNITGTTRSNLPGNDLLQSFQCAGVWSEIEGELTGNGYCESVAAGDKIFSKTSRVGSTTTTTLLHGTGRFAGITGSGTNEDMGRFPTIREGKIQGCNRGKGTWKLP
jgi:hypothetical protein